MANTKISALSSGSPAQATDVVAIARGGANYKLSVADITAGLAPLIFDDASATLTANYNSGAAKTIITSPAAGSLFKISGVQAINRAATTSSTLPSLTLSWTDAGGVARTQVLVSTSTTNTTAVLTSFSTQIHTNGSNVTLTSASYASSGATAMQYSLAYSIEELI